MLVQLSGKQVEYEVASRLIVGGRVYLPKQRVMLDSAEGEVLKMRGFVRVPKVASKHTPDKGKELPVPASQIGTVTKVEESIPSDADADAPSSTAPASEQGKEQSNHGKSARRGR